MATIAPFRGVRYNSSLVGEMDKLVSPPYDVISPEQRVQLHEQHENNFVRLILGEERSGDDDECNRFMRARDFLDDWINEGVLVRDEKPAIYVYEQQFVRDGKSKIVRGITAAVKIHEYADSVVLPHENTLAKPKSQLIQLLRETQANLDSIYGLFSDEQGITERVIDHAMASQPLARVQDGDGVKHALWRIDDPEEIRQLVDCFADKQIAIADGHHRYETTLNYRNEMRAKSGNPNAELPSDFVLMTLVNVYQPDITVYPTHRVVANIPADLLVKLDESLTESFEVADSSKERLLGDMSQRGAIGIYRNGKVITAKAKPGKKIAGEMSEASRNLELNVLHELILHPLLEIDQEKLRNQTNIIYTRDTQEAMELVDSGERQIAFLLNNMDVKSVLDVASAGERMPQKATYFYPKLISGLVLRTMS